jgi:hypothetical protein
MYLYFSFGSPLDHLGMSFGSPGDVLWITTGSPGDVLGITWALFIFFSFLIPGGPFPGTNRLFYCLPKATPNGHFKTFLHQIKKRLQKGVDILKNNLYLALEHNEKQHNQGGHHQTHRSGKGKLDAKSNSRGNVIRSLDGWGQVKTLKYHPENRIAPGNDRWNRHLKETRELTGFLTFQQVT